jgi:hypothetical protein
VVIDADQRLSGEPRRRGVSVLLGTLLGGLVSLAAVVVSGRYAARTELRRQRFAANNAASDRVRVQVAEVLRLLLLVEYEIFAVSWLARERPDRLDAEFARGYEQRVGDALARLSGAMVILAGLNKTIHSRLLMWYERLDEIEGRAARVMLGLPENLEEAAGQLAELAEPVRGFYRELPAASLLPWQPSNKSRSPRSRSHDVRSTSEIQLVPRYEVRLGRKAGLPGGLE